MRPFNNASGIVDRYHKRQGRDSHIFDDRLEIFFNPKFRGTLEVCTVEIVTSILISEYPSALGQVDILPSYEEPQ